VKTAGKVWTWKKHTAEETTQIFCKHPRLARVVSAVISG
jgi:hypothetical protein